MKYIQHSTKIIVFSFCGNGNSRLYQPRVASSSSSFSSSSVVSVSDEGESDRFLHLCSSMVLILLCYRSAFIPAKPNICFSIVDWGQFDCQYPGPSVYSHVCVKFLAIVCGVFKFNLPRCWNRAPSKCSQLQIQTGSGLTGGATVNCNSSFYSNAMLSRFDDPAWLDIALNKSSFGILDLWLRLWHRSSARGW